MTIEQFRAVWRARPFRPFVLRTAGGELHAVNHPEMVLVNSSGRGVVVTAGDAFSIFDLSLVEAVEVNAPPIR